MTLEETLKELRRSPIGPMQWSNVRAVCPRCMRERRVTADGRFTVHNDDNGAWCNGSREVVRA